MVTKKSTKMIKKPINLIAFFLCSLCFVVSLVLLLQTLHEQNKQEQNMKQLQAIVHITETPTITSNLIPDDEMEQLEPMTEETIQNETTYIDLDALVRLKEENADLIGWITIPDTTIDYPVMQSCAQEDFYLSHNFMKEPSKYGVPYIEEECDLVNGCDNIVIYGHHMKDGTMFTPLINYKEKDFYVEHPYILFSTLTISKKYEIIGVFLEQYAVIDDESFLFHKFTKADDIAEYGNYVSQVKMQSLYEIPTTAYYKEQFLTLSTCDRTVTEGRLVVVAKEIKE